MRSHRRRDPLEHVVIAGDLAELPSIRALLALLPESAYGQVYVETGDGEDLPAIGAPHRVTVTRVARARHQGPGESLSAAIAGWVAEWMPEESDPGREVSMWVGARVAGGVPTLGANLERL